MESLSKSLAAYEELDDLRGVAYSLNRIGAVLSADRAEEARIVFNRALRTARAAGNLSTEKLDDKEGMLIGRLWPITNRRSRALATATRDHCMRHDFSGFRDAS